MQNAEELTPPRRPATRGAADGDAASADSTRIRAPAAPAEQSVRPLLGLILAGSAAYFTYRAVWRGITASRDLTVGYSAARAWLHGLNPYHVSVLESELTSAGGGALAGAGVLDMLLNVYAPVTLIAFLPLTPFPWAVAKPIWLIANVLATVGIVWALCQLNGWPLRSRSAALLAAFTLALAPIHTSISSGQSAVLATFGIVLGALLQSRHRPYAAGIAYGLAAVVKVQLALPFLAYLMWRRRWGTVATALGVLTLLTLVSVGRMAVSGVDWYPTWTSNLSQAFGEGGLNDPSRAGPNRASLINLQYPLHTLIGHAGVVNAIVFAGVGAAALLTVLLIRDREPRRELLALSLVAILGLLATYHRYYDAALLVLPIAWGIAALSTPHRRMGIAALVLCGNLLLPAQTALHVWARDGLVPDWLAGHILWTGVVMAQHTWSLALLAGVLLCAAAGSRGLPEGDLPRASPPG